MLDLKEVPDYQPASYKVGLNQFFLKSFAIEEGQYGPQLLFEFAATSDENAKVFKHWFAFQQAFERVDAAKDAQNARNFKGKLSQFKGFLNNYLEFGEEVWQEVFNTAFANPFDETNPDAIAKVQKEFFKGIFAKLPKGFEKMPINVWLHYKGGYLNIPSYKENGYNLPFGKDPIEGKDLNFEKPVREDAPGQSDEVSGTVGNEIDTVPVSDGDLPF